MGKRAAPEQHVPPRAEARNPNGRAEARNLKGLAEARKLEVTPPKRNYAPRGIAGLLAPVVRPAFTRRAPAAAALLADWPNLAGAELAVRAAPVKFAGGTLTLACEGPAALELQHMAPDIIARLNLTLGCRLVERLRFVQQATGVADPIASVRRKAPAPIPTDLPEGPVGEALARLYQAIHAKGD